MTIPAANLTTDEIAAETRRIARENPAHANPIRPAAAQLARVMTERLPYIDPADIAAVMLHVGSYLATTTEYYRANRVPDRVAAALGVNVVAIAGEQLHRKHSGATR